LKAKRRIAAALAERSYLPSDIRQRVNHPFTLYPQVRTMSYIYNSTSYNNLCDAQLAAVSDYITCGGNSSSDEIREYLAHSANEIAEDMKDDSWRVPGEPDNEHLLNLICDVKDSYL
jgi:hypothetical protein